MQKWEKSTKKNDNEKYTYEKLKKKVFVVNNNIESITMPAKTQKIVK